MASPSPLPEEDGENPFDPPDLTVLMRLSPVEFADYLRLLEEEGKAWTLHPKQQLAEDMSSRVFELLYGGSAGSAKSEWLLWHEYHLALRFPGWHGLIIRHTYKELSRTLIPRSLERFDNRLATYRSSEHTWWFGNGSTIEFGYLEGPYDHLRYQSAEYDVCAWDELTHFQEAQYTYLFSRVRTTAAKAALGVVPHVIAGTNPGGPGGVWVKKRFVDQAPPGTIFEAPMNEEDRDDPSAEMVRRVFVPAFAKDNPSLDQAAYRRSLSGLSEKLRGALRDGRWDVVEGQFFDEWDPNLHVCEPFEIPRGWVRIRAVDYGYTNLYVCLWIAFDPDGNAWVYREDPRAHLTPPEQAARMIAMSKYPDGTAERIDYTVADMSCWTRTGIGDPISQQWYLAGLRGLKKPMNARVDGWARVREFLHPDENRHVKLRIFNTCRYLIETLPQAVMSTKDPEDVDTDGDDHGIDSLRYGLLSRARKPRGPRDRGPVGIEAARAETFKNLDRKGGRVSHPDLGWVI